jgi:hypothetical protein
VNVNELCGLHRQTRYWLLPGGSRLCLFNEPSGVTLAMIQSAQK